LNDQQHNDDGQEDPCPHHGHVTLFCLLALNHNHGVIVNFLNQSPVSSLGEVIFTSLQLLFEEVQVLLLDWVDRGDYVPEDTLTTWRSSD